MKTHFITLIVVALLLADCGKKNDQNNFNEKSALEFLYQSMPLGDSVDYSQDYFRECVDYAFRAKAELPWGKDIPEREFKHFVLPPRVNNENLDRFRATYYEELKTRVQNLTLYEAVLEVNHWCHERVNYKGSDSRTSAPMATIKTSWGRCGEESTLLVTALRTVGIPARQVYTPRWAHCDDNHAWVEAWVDGKWHFLGACEPEPVLDLGWFNDPASRALLLHTRVFGDYDGPEEVISRNKYYTEINVVDNYGKTAKTTFTVVDQEGKPQAGLTVEFKIYNYAEFCTVVRKTTDANGQTWLTSGLGCMMAYAAKDGKFGFQVFKAGQQEQVTIVLDHDFSEGIANPSFEFDMVPPTPSALSPEVTPEMRAENDRRVRYEDSLRNAYIADCKKAQQEIIGKTGNKTLCSIYEKTWGNYQTIADFVKYAQEQGKEVEALMLLETLSDKDLRDITLDVLVNHFNSELGMRNAELSSESNSAFRIPNSEFIISPRISNEMIVPWRKTFTEFFTDEEAQRYHDNPSMLVDWVKQNITVNDELNPQRIPISPIGVFKARKADRRSRDIFFVAMARSLGIAAQIHPVTGKVQYLEKEWVDVDFEAEQPAVAEMGYLDIQYNPIASLPNPKYYSQFSIKKFDGNSFKLLAYDAQDPGIDDGMMLSTFGHSLPLEAGDYILTAGNRLPDGTALTHSEFFTIKPGKVTQVNLILREHKQELQVIGHFDAGDFTKEIEGYYILGLLDQGSEPTIHALNDIETFRKSIEDTGIPMLFISNDQNGFEAVRQALVNNLQLDKTILPIFIIGNAKGEVYFVQQGYTIGLGVQIIKAVFSVVK